MIKKTILVSLLFMGSLHAESFNNYLFNYNAAKVKKSPFLIDVKDHFFLKDYTILVNTYSKDSNLKKAMFELDKKDDNGTKTIVDFNIALDYLVLSAEEGNEMASILGLNILENYFLLSGNIVGKTYLRKIAKPLADKENPIGLFWYGRSFMQNFSIDGVDYDNSQIYLTKAAKKCEDMLKLKKYKENEELIQIKNLAELDSFKSRTMLKIEANIAKGNYQRVKRDIIHKFSKKDSNE